MDDTRVRGTDWKHLVLSSVAIGVGLAVVLGALGTVLDVSLSPLTMGVVGGTITGIVIGIYRSTLRN